MSLPGPVYKVRWLWVRRPHEKFFVSNNYMNITEYNYIFKYCNDVNESNVYVSLLRRRDSRETRSSISVILTSLDSSWHC